MTWKLKSQAGSTNGVRAWLVEKISACTCRTAASNTARKTCWHITVGTETGRQRAALASDNPAHDDDNAGWDGRRRHSQCQMPFVVTAPPLRSATTRAVSEYILAVLRNVLDLVDQYAPVQRCDNTAVARRGSSPPPTSPQRL